MNTLNRTTKRILVVEDEPSIGNMCQRVLTREGLEVEIAANGSLAQDMIRKKHYDLCLVDIRTPKMSGAELYQWLQKEYPQVANHVIFTTGSVIDEKTMAFIKQSGRPFLPKPFTPDELTAIVKESLKQLQKWWASYFCQSCPRPENQQYTCQVIRYNQRVFMVVYLFVLTSESQASGMLSLNPNYSSGEKTML